MRSEDLREFAQRPRDAIAEAKREHWRSVANSDGGQGAFDAAQTLYEHAHTVAGFPSERYLAEDFAHQLHLKQLIDRASQALLFARPTR